MRGWVTPAAERRCPSALSNKPSGPWTWGHASAPVARGRNRHIEWVNRAEQGIGPGSTRDTLRSIHGRAPPKTTRHRSGDGGLRKGRAPEDPGGRALPESTNRLPDRTRGWL